MAPADNKKGKHRAAYRQVPPPPCPGILYTVAPGDTLFILSTRFGTPLNDIIAANPQIVDPNKIFAGQTICIPAGT
jgi:LysM repeat protein